MKSDCVTIALRYGAEERQVAVPRPTLLDEARMREVEPAADPETVVEAVLDAPIGCPPLEVLARGAERVVVLVDDLTRPTPAHRLLPAILRRLERADVAREAIRLLVATGTHRPMTAAELEAKVGAETMAAYQVVNHDYRKTEELVDLGYTESGIPVTVNRMVAEADFVLAVGNIVPHRYCGWAGGAKMIQPGVGGEPTTAATHLMITKDPGARLGVVENQVRHEIETVAERVNLKFVVNTILDRHANIVDVVAGDVRRAFRRGVELARRVYSADLSGQADIVLASAYPSDINFWQAGKALYAADLVVRDGGIIILASPCYEGIGEHEEFADLLREDYHSIEGRIHRGEVRDRVGAAAALAVALVRARADIWLVSGPLMAEPAARAHLPCFENLQEAVDAALRAKGPAARLTVLHEATEILPVLPKAS